MIELYYSAFVEFEVYLKINKNGSLVKIHTTPSAFCLVQRKSEACFLHRWVFKEFCPTKIIRLSCVQMLTNICITLQTKAHNIHYRCIWTSDILLFVPKWRHFAERTIQTYPAASTVERKTGGSQSWDGISQTKESSQGGRIAASLANYRQHNALEGGKVGDRVGLIAPTMQNSELLAQQGPSATTTTLASTAPTSSSVLCDHILTQIHWRNSFYPLVSPSVSFSSS